MMLAGTLLCSPALQAPLPAAPLPEYTYRIVQTFDHDEDAFTQGFLFHDGVFYESTGRYGESTLRRVEPSNGKVVQSISLPDHLFGEGITIFNGKIYQLTWRSHTAFVYNLESFEQIDTFHYPTEGWGLTNDGTHLIMSDGSNRLFFRDPDTFKEKRRLRVDGPTGPVTELNELEYIEGEILANVWQTDQIVRIDPETGRLTGRIWLDNLLDHVNLNKPADVLNGIAYAPDSSRLFVTGKWWPAVFEIELFPKPSDDAARIIRWQLAGERFEVTFHATEDYSYRLQATSSLEDGDWSDLESRLTGHGHVSTLTTPPTLSGSRHFFRLVKRR